MFETIRWDGMSMLRQFLQDQSIHNQPTKIIYQYIFQNGLVSRAEIIEKTNLNRGKVARSLKELLEKNYIQVEGLGDSEGGRPPTLYQMNPVISFLIGIQITRWETKIVLYDLLLNKTNEKTVIMLPDHSPAFVIDEIKNTINEFMKIHSIQLEDILGIGIGAIGPLDSEKGTILQSEPFLPMSWGQIPVVDQIKKEFPIFVKLDNAANTIVLGESKQYPAFQNILNVTVGWTLGSGAIHNGKLLKIESGDIAGYGHIVIHMDGKPCYCGKKGCMTAYSSLYAILERIKECSPAFYLERLKGFSPVDQISHIVAEHDQMTKEVIMDSAKYIGVGLANLATIFHSEIVIVNGPLISQFPGYYEEIIQQASLHMNDQGKIQFRKGNFQRDPGTLGAAMLVLNSLLGE